MGADRPGLVGGHLYAHLGIESRLLDPDTVETTLPASEAVLIQRGMRAAPLGLAMEHAMPLLAKAAAVPVVISVHVRGTEVGGDRIHVVSRLVKSGRTIMVTEAVFRNKRETTLGFGTVTWSVVRERQEVPSPGTTAPPSGAPAPQRTGSTARPPVLEALGVRLLPADDGCELPAVSVAGPGGILHAGAVQFLCEEAALIAGRARAHAADVSTRDCVLHLLAVGRAGPFRAKASLLAPGHEGGDFRAELREEHDGSRLLAMADLRLAFD